VKKIIIAFCVAAILLLFCVPAFALGGEVVFNVNGNMSSVELTSSSTLFIKYEGGFVKYGVGSTTYQISYESQTNYDVTIVNEDTGVEIDVFNFDTSTDWSYSVGSSGHYSMGISYTSSVPTYSITFNSNGGSAISTLTYQQSIPVDINTAYIPTRSGYAFDGWYRNSTFTTVVSPGQTLTSNITLYAKWHAVYSITFNSNGGSSISLLTGRTSIPSDIQFSSSYLPTKEGYTFDGWYTDVDLMSQAVGGAALSANLTLYAKWIDVNNSSVFFLYPGGNSETIYYGSATNFVLKQSGDRIRFGLGTTSAFSVSRYIAYDPDYLYDFEIINEDTGASITTGTRIVSGDVYSWPFASNAHYSVIIHKYENVSNRLIFDTQGGSSVSPIVCDEVPELEDIPETTRDGWIFNGWHYSPTGENFIVSGDAVVGTVTVYAHWIGFNHLHLNPNGGDFLGEYLTDLSYDYVPEALPRVYRAGYKFLGWYYQDGSEVNAGDQITGTVYIFAYWEQLDTTGLSFEDGYRQGQADAEAMKSIINNGWSVFYSGFNDFTHSTTIGGITIISLLATIVVVVILFFVAKLFFKG